MLLSETSTILEEVINTDYSIIKGNERKVGKWKQKQKCELQCARKKVSVLLSVRKT